MDENLIQNDEKSYGLGKILAWVFVIGLLLLVGVQLVESQKGISARGDVAPEFVLTTFEGVEYRSEDLIGKVVVLNIWASWCKPCEQEADDLQAAWELYEPRGDVIFLGVDYVDTDKEAKAFIERFSITYPNGPDIGTRIYASFRARGVPETFIIDKNGKIAFVKIGPFASLIEITSAIDPLLEP